MAFPNVLLPSLSPLRLTDPPPPIAHYAHGEGHAAVIQKRESLRAARALLDAQDPERSGELDFKVLHEELAGRYGGAAAASFEECRAEGRPAER